LLRTSCIWKQSAHRVALPYHTGKVCYRLELRPPVGPLCISDWNLLEFLANFKSELQCSCRNSLENKRCLPNCFLHFSTTALHLPRRCRLVSYCSPQRGHIGSFSIFSKVKCRFCILCPVRRPTRIFKSS